MTGKTVNPDGVSKTTSQTPCSFLRAGTTDLDDEAVIWEPNKTMKTNTATILGNVGSTRLFQEEENKDKQDLLSIDVACNSKSGEKEYVSWYKVKVWGALAAKLAPLIQKGDKLLVSGRPEAKGYLRKDGTAGADLVLHADDVQLLTTRQAAVDDNSSVDENN